MSNGGALPADGSQIEDLIGTARSRGTGCHWRSVGHEYIYRRYRAAGTATALAIGTASAIAGSALLGAAGDAWAIVAGVIGLLGALLAVVERGFDLPQRADDNRQAATAFRVVRNRYWSFASHPPPSPDAAGEALDAIDAEHNDVELKSIPVEEWAEKKATAGYNQAMERLAAERKETNG